ncbi:MAG: 23S rRNA (guanosine(2251)-2'-O)-methyltransferase RlmB [Gammaproteobacteria bacterium]
MTAKKVEYIYGYHTLAQALESTPEAILEVSYVKPNGVNRRLQTILDRCQALDIACQHIMPQKLDKLTGTTKHQGIAARYTAPGLNTSINHLCDGDIAQTSLILALDGIQDPHNLGACIRTANAAGVQAVLIPADRSAPVNATVRKVACGAVEATDVIRVTNLSRALKRLQEAGYWVVGADGQAEADLFDFVPQQPLVLVVGAEDSGLRHNTRRYCDYLLKIPMSGAVASLNVSVATGVCLYLLRSRQQD